MTEAPEETPKTNFTYEDSRVSITAEAEEGANLPQDAELKVDYLQNTDPEKYNAEIAELNNLIGVDNEKITDDEVCQSNLRVYINKKEDTTAEFEKDETDAIKHVSFKTSESGSITLYVTEVDSKGNPVAGAAVFFKRRKK